MNTASMQRLQKLWKSWYSLQVAAAKVAVQAETSSAAAEKTPPQKDSNSVVLQNTSITTGKTKLVDITFVPKTVSLSTVYKKTA